MKEDLQQVADACFSKALAAAGARDPRDYYRDGLRELKRFNADGYGEAVAYYRKKLIPSIAQGDAEPLEAWRTYGLLIARLTSPGRTVAVDPRGHARAYEPPAEVGDMILHLPSAKGARVFVVGLPPNPSDAQTATCDWLALGRRALRDRPGRGSRSSGP